MNTTPADPDQSAARECARIKVRYLGQTGFQFQLGGLGVLIDPYLTDSIDRMEGQPAGFWVRNYPPPIRPGQLRNVDLVLCTHDHLDHTDPETLLGIAAASPRCRFAGPRRAACEMERSGIAAERIAVLNEGAPFAFHDLVVDPIAAAHESYETDSQGFHRCLGFLLRWKSFTLFHAGDSVATPRLVKALEGHAIDLAFLPINGADETRHRFDVIGNMNATEAILFASWLAAGKGLDMVVPMHYDLYSSNGAKLSDFVAAWESRPAPKPKFKAFLPAKRWRMRRVKGEG